MNPKLHHSSIHRDRTLEFLMPCKAVGASPKAVLASSP